MLSMSLDGYFEGPGGELDWHRVDEELHQHFNDLLAPMSVFIDGRVNYELMASYWPHADEDPSATPQERVRAYLARHAQARLLTDASARRVERQDRARRRARGGCVPARSCCGWHFEPSRTTTSRSCRRLRSNAP